MSSKKAVVLISGGLDSSTILAMARSQGYDCYALSFNYGQRNVIELEMAAKMAQAQQVLDHKIIHLGIGQLGGSALTDKSIEIPVSGPGTDIPITYVPARNTVFLSIALGWAELLKASAIFIGINDVDYSGYPDCRPEYLEAFQKLANLATKAGVEGNELEIKAPLLYLKKSEIIKLGTSLGVDYRNTVTCYQPDDQRRACGSCDSCTFRKQGFIEAGVPDPTIYQTNSMA